MVRRIRRGHSVAGAQRATETQKTILCRGRIEEFIQTNAIVQGAREPVSQVETETALVVGAELAKSDVEHPQGGLPVCGQSGWRCADLSVDDGAVIATERHVLEENIGSSRGRKLPGREAQHQGSRVGSVNLQLQRGNLCALGNQFDLAVAQAGLNHLTKIRKAHAASTGSEIGVIDHRETIEGHIDIRDQVGSCCIAAVIAHGDGNCRRLIDLQAEVGVGAHLSVDGQGDRLGCRVGGQSLEPEEVVHRIQCRVAGRRYRQLHLIHRGIDGECQLPISLFTDGYDLAQIGKATPGQHAARGHRLCCKHGLQVGNQLVARGVAIDRTLQQCQVVAFAIESDVEGGIAISRTAAPTCERFVRR